MSTILLTTILFSLLIYEHQTENIKYKHYYIPDCYKYDNVIIDNLFKSGVLMPKEVKYILSDEQVLKLYNSKNDLIRFIFLYRMLPELKDWINLKKIFNLIKSKRNPYEINKFLFTDLIKYIHIRKLNKNNRTKYNVLYQKITQDLTQTITKLYET